MSFSIETLEFELLKHLLSRYVSTEEARSAIAAIVPSVELSVLESTHELTTEAMSYLRVNRVPFRQTEFLAEAMEKLRVAVSFLEIPEIEAVQRFLGHIEG